MNIISWNINGIRANYNKGAFTALFDGSLLKTKNKKLIPDIICFQETKADVEQLHTDITDKLGYHTYFSSSKLRKGYSGVAMYSKIQPLKVVYGIPSTAHAGDPEGRLITAEFEKFFLVTGYYPNGGSGPHRLEYKLQFYDDFLNYIKKLDKKKPVIFCGDVNTAHTPIDLARPRENEKNTGFLPVERAWIDRVIKSGFIDIFRNLYPNKLDSYTYWDQKTSARNRNVGWRIDYFFASKSLLPNITDATIFSEVLGSDHCPIMLTLKD